MNHGHPMDDELVDMLVQRAVGELDAVDEPRLHERLRGMPAREAGSFDRAAAAVHLAFLGVELQPLPGALRARLEQDSARWVEGTAPESGPAVLGGPAPHAAAPSALASPWLGWLVAAACLLLAAGAWLRSPPRTAGLEEPSLELEWGRLAARRDAVQRDWSPTEDPLAAGVSGAVLWSPEEQRGYMRFRHLAANDTASNQYQLWIFDAERDDAHPVDGGVFDSSTEGELIVPIDAKLVVGQAKLFAVTYERPGGVVVSTRERLLLTAAL